MSMKINPQKTITQSDIIKPKAPSTFTQLVPAIEGFVGANSAIIGTVTMCLPLLGLAMLFGGMAIVTKLTEGAPTQVNDITQNQLKTEAKDYQI